MLLQIKKTIFRIKTKWNTFRSKIKLKSYGPGLKVNYRCHFTRNTSVGKDCHFNGISIVGDGEVKIGDHFHSGSNILILTANHNYYSPNALPYDTIDILKPVHIGTACWVGSKVILLPGVDLGDGVVVQAGAVVSGAFPKGTVIGGNPAKIIKYRDLKKFDYLMKKSKFV